MVSFESQRIELTWQRFELSECSCFEYEINKLTKGMLGGDHLLPDKDEDLQVEETDDDDRGEDSSKCKEV